MYIPKKDRAARTDLEREGLAAAEMQLAAVSEINLPVMLPGCGNAHLEPVHAPVMPTEVFYNKLALNEDWDFTGDPTVKL